MDYRRSAVVRKYLEPGEFLMLGNLAEFGVCSWQIKPIDMVKEECDTLYDFVVEEILDEEAKLEKTLEILIGSAPADRSEDSLAIFRLIYMKQFFEEAENNEDSWIKKYLQGVVKSPFVLSYMTVPYVSNLSKGIPESIGQIVDPLIKISWVKFERLLNFIIDLVADKQEISRI